MTTQELEQALADLLTSHRQLQHRLDQLSKRMDRLAAGESTRRELLADYRERQRLVQEGGQRLRVQIHPGTPTQPE